MRYVNLAVWLFAGLAAAAQVQPNGSRPAAAATPATTSGPLSIDLPNALERARAYNQQFLSAGTAASLAREDRVQARAALLPTLNALNQYLYTQGNGTPSGVFVANDGVHIYNEQALVHAELFSLTRHAEYRRAVAAEAVAQARRDIALRGLAATVVQGYYALVGAARRLANARTSVDEARRFLDITQKQESGGEAAHADVVKAQLEIQQRQRDLTEAETNLEKSKLAVGVLMFADIAQPFDVVDDLRPDLPLSTADEIRDRAFSNNPDIRAAEAGVRETTFGVKAARGAYFPSLAIDYFFGFDANVFGLHGPDGRHNLGSVVQGTINVPVWNWGTTGSKVRQAELQKRQSELDLSFAHRQLQANVSNFYLEAQAARVQIDSLRSSVELSVESLRLTVLRYQGGEATALEVVDAQNTLAASRNAYDDGLARYRVALANLQILAGRL
jgi:outer membrane protein TolC